MADSRTTLLRSLALPCHIIFIRHFELCSGPQSRLTLDDSRFTTIVHYQDAVLLIHHGPNSRICRVQRGQQWLIAVLVPGLR